MILSSENDLALCFNKTWLQEMRMFSSSIDKCKFTWS